jgi:hypothetical protein
MTIELRAAGKRFGLGQRVIAVDGNNLAARLWESLPLAL